MKNVYIKFAALLFFSIAFISCEKEMTNYEIQKALNIDLVDNNATYETIALFHNLKGLAGKNILFGHQHTTEYGVKWKGDKNRSDIKDVSGSFPALYGWDFFIATEKEKREKQKYIAQLIKDAHKRGGVQAFCWHYENPVTGGTFYDTTRAVEHILPGKKFHEKYKADLDSIVAFNNLLVDENGNKIPIIFRPFHEFDGFWFWWGKRFVSKEDFIALWKFTVEYLRDVKKVNNFLYAYSPDRNFDNEEEYFERYPGDDYVDIFGVDDYWDFTENGDGLESITRKLKLISKLSEKRNKICAFTETGSEKVLDDKWWTTKLLKVMDVEGVTATWVMVWRNAHLDHFYAPYKEHASAPDFIEFANHSKILLENELPNMFVIDEKLFN